MKTKSLFNRRVRIGFGAAIVSLLAMGTMSYRGMVESSKNEQWVRHTHEVVENLLSLRSAMENVESSYKAPGSTKPQSTI
jgi:CHASE3 domain sensor protein